MLKSLLIPLLMCSLPAFAQTTNNDASSVDRPLKSKQEREMQRIKDVAHSLESRTSGLTSIGASAVWLNADNQDFLGIYTPAAREQTYGTVLILHTEGEHPLWPGAILNLQNYLPEKGWATFSIALPDQIYPDPPPRPTKEEIESQLSAKKNAAADPKAEEIKAIQNRSDSGQQEIESKAQNRIIAAMQYLNENEQDQIVLYGQGLGGLRASVNLKALTESGASSRETIKGLILVDSQNEISLSKKGSDQIDINTVYGSFTDPVFPILDIISNPSPQNIQKSKRRRNQAKINGLQKYHQHPVTTPNGRIFLTTIYGYLKKHFQ